MQTGASRPTIAGLPILSFGSATCASPPCHSDAQPAVILALLRIDYYFEVIHYSRLFPPVATSAHDASLLLISFSMPPYIHVALTLVYHCTILPAWPVNNRSTAASSFTFTFVLVVRVQDRFL